MRKGIIVGGLASLVVLATILVAAHQAVFAALLPRIISLATGYDVSVGDERFELNHAALLHVRVTKRGEPVLEAARVDIGYSLRDLLPGSKHRYGVSSVAIDRPTLTLVRHKDGSYNLAFPQGNGPAPIGPVPVNRVPVSLTVRIRDAAGEIRAPYALDPQARSLSVHNVNVDATIDTAAQTHYTVAGSFIEHPDEPFAALGTIDVVRGYAMHHAYAAAVPLRAIANYFIDSNAARILAGNATNFDARAYAIDVRPDEPITYHLGAQLDLRNGGLAIVGLAQPLGNIAGHLQLVDDAFYANRLEGTLAGIPVSITGGIYDFAAPKYQLGVSAHGALAKLRTVFGFSRTQPVDGIANVGVLVEGKLGAPIVVANADASNVVYRNVPLRDVHASLAFANQMLYLAPLRARTSGADLTLAGTLATAGELRSRFALHVAAPADRLPYAGEVLGTEPLLADALIDGKGTSIYAHGALASARGVARVAANFDFEPNGIITVAPFWVHGGHGSIDGAYHLDRAHDASSFWLVANGVDLRAPRTTSFLNVTLPQIPAIEGRVDRVALEGGGPSGSGAFAAGTVAAHGLHVSGVAIDSLGARFAGTVARAAFAPVSASGPWGAIEGNGALAQGALTVSGDYRGSLRGLRPFLANAPADGTIEGPVALAIGAGKITVQGDRLRLQGAHVRGIPVSGISGTLSFERGVVRVYSARAALAGGDVVAAGAYDTSHRGSGAQLSLVAVGLAGAGLHGLGLPFDAGTVDADGRLAGETPLPQFDGGISVARGRVAKYDVAGSGVVHLGGNSVRVEQTLASLDGTYATVDGSLGALTSGAPTYALHANVPAGDVARALQSLAIPGYASDGTFNAALSVGGRGLDPAVRGPIAVPAGSINGLPYLDGRASIAADRSGIVARHGNVLVGTTLLGFAAARAPRISGVHVRAPMADLADFNNFFDTGDTLHGRGNVAFNVVSAHRRLASNGQVDVKAFRFRNIDIGDTRATWSSARNLLRGSLAVGGANGTLTSHGAVALAPELEWQSVLRDSHYNVHADVDNLDLSTWIATLGFPEIPVTGRLDGDMSVDGRYPQLHLGGTATLRSGTIWQLPLERFNLAFSSSQSRVRIDKAELAAPGVDATGSGSFGLTSAAPLAFDVHATSDDLPRLVEQLARVHVPVTGTFEASVHVGGTFVKPTFAAAFDATDVDAYNVKIPTAFGSLRLDGRALQLRDAGLSFERGNITIAGTLPLQLSPFGVGPASSPINVDLAMTGVNPSDFAALLGNHSQLAGTVDGQVGLAGTVAQPRISGRFTLADGAYNSDLERSPITDARATLIFDRTSATVEKLHALLGQGSLDGAGRIVFENGFANAAAGGATFDVNALARGAQLDLPAYGRGTLDAKLALVRRTNREAVLSGNATLSNAVIPFAAFLAATQNGASGGGSGAPPLALGFNLNMTAAKNVRVRGSGFGGGLDIGALGAVTLAGNVAAPTLDGSFTSTGGTLTYFDRAFRVTSGVVAFAPANGVIPTLHATGTTNVVNPDPNTARNPYGSAEISINVDGPVNNLKVAFDSNPPGYSKEQILAMIAPFGGFISGIGYSPGISSATPSQQLGALTPVPGSTLLNQTGTITVGQEAFNVLNAQFTAGLLAPFENAISQGLGFQDFNLTVDYYGNVGFSARRLLGRTVSFIYASTFGIPTRQSFGLELQGSDATSAQLSFFFQNGPTRLFQTPGAVLVPSGRLSIGEALQGDSGFSFTLQRLYW